MPINLIFDYCLATGDCLNAYGAVSTNCQPTEEQDLEEKTKKTIRIVQGHVFRDYEDISVNESLATVLLKAINGFQGAVLFYISRFFSSDVFLLVGGSR